MSPIADRSTLRLVAGVLERKDRVRLALSLALILIGTLLEMASLGLVIPVVQAVVSGDRRGDYAWLPEQLAEVSYSAFVQLLMAALVGVFVVKNVFLLASNYYQQRAQLSINNRIVQRLFENYLRQPYEFHLTSSSSVLVRNVQEYSSAVISGGVGPALMILTDVVTGLGLLSVLVLVQPASTAMLVGLFALSSYAILRLSRTRTRRWGAARVKHRGELMEALLSGFGGIKDIKLFGSDRAVVDSHRTSLHLAARANYMFSVMQSVPRAVFEVMAVGGVALLVVVATFDGQNLQDATLIIALFGVVAFRMLPSVNRVIQSVQQLSFGRAGIEGAAEGLSLSQQATSSSAGRQTNKFERLEISNLKYSYPNSDALVTNIAALTVTAGDSVGIVGASGSGKSTLVDLLLGILAPRDGTITVNGHDVNNNRRYWQDRIGYVPQHVYLMDTSLRRNVAFGLAEKSISNADVEKALRLANLWEFVQALPDGLDTVVGERGVRLSGGQRQRLGIARALYGNPEVIVLDEATSALDGDTEREIVESLRAIAHDHTLIVVAHRTTTLAYCSRLIRLDGGRIVQDGTFAEVIGSLPVTESEGQ
jgi:ABC-type multidrug transport system fused ATPase/permease subunit